MNTKKHRIIEHKYYDHDYNQHVVYYVQYYGIKENGWFWQKRKPDWHYVTEYTYATMEDLWPSEKKEFKTKFAAEEFIRRKQEAEAKKTTDKVIQV